MIHLLNLSVWQIVCLIHSIGVILSYMMTRTVNRNATSEDRNRYGNDYTYGHVFANFILSILFSWVTLIICCIMWLGDKKYRSHTDPPSWL